MDLILHISPGACSRVPLIALEEIGAPFATRVVAFMKGGHRSTGYLRLNPAGKVPTLVVDGRAIGQNVAILSFLAHAFPGAGLLPLTGDPLADADLLGQLAWFAADLHPLVTRIRIPSFACDLPGAPERVRALASAAMSLQLAAAEARLAEMPWLLGSTWSVLDAYLHWVWFRISGAGFAGEFPHISAHYEAMALRPSVQRALARESAAEDELRTMGALVTFPPLTGTLSELETQR
jgi:glutathione S-transferase